MVNDDRMEIKAQVWAALRPHKVIAALSERGRRADVVRLTAVISFMIEQMQKLLLELAGCKDDNDRAQKLTRAIQELAVKTIVSVYIIGFDCQIEGGQGDG